MRSPPPGQLPQGSTKFNRGLGCGRLVRDVDSHQLQDVGIVVNRRETDLIVVELNETKPKRSARHRIDGKLADEPALDRELDDFAGLVWVGINAVAVADQQVPVGRLRHRECPVQVDVIRVDDCAFTLTIRQRSSPVSGIRNGKHFVVAGRGNIKDFVLRIVNQTGRSHFKRDRIGSMDVARSYQRLAQHEEFAAGDREVEPRDRPREHVGDEDFHEDSFVLHREVPRPLDKARKGQGVREFPEAVYQQERTWSGHR